MQAGNGLGTRERDAWSSASASSVSPQRLTFLPLHRALLLRDRQPGLGGPWGRTPVPYSSLCHQSGHYGDHQLLSVFLALLVGVAPFPGQWSFRRSPTPAAPHPLCKAAASLACLLVADKGPRHFPSPAPHVSPSCRLWFLQLPKINK